MNLDLSVHRMAFRETASTGVAQALVAKKRLELELRLLSERAESAGPRGADLETALRRLQDESRAAVHADGGAGLDRSA